MRKLNSAITRRFIKFLEQNSADDPKSYGDFYGKFGFFIKEGVASDFEHREQLQGLLRFESSRRGEGELVSFEDYLSGMGEGQEEIYYLFGSARDSA